MHTETLEDRERHALIFNTQPRQIVVLEADIYRIGRSTSNEVVLLYNTISRQHATLIRVLNSQTQRSQYQLLDGTICGQASINGTYVNGKLSTKHTLNHDDHISFGQVVEAAYQKLELDEIRFNSYLTWLAETPLLEAMSASQHLSTVEPTSIMLGGSGGEVSTSHEVEDLALKATVAV